MSLEHRVIDTLEELEVICKNKNSMRITYTNVTGNCEYFRNQN